jgi:hypothetical protein
VSERLAADGHDVEATTVAVRPLDGYSGVMGEVAFVDLGFADNRSRVPPATSSTSPTSRCSPPSSNWPALCKLQPDTAPVEILDFFERTWINDTETWPDRIGERPWTMIHRRLRIRQHRLRHRRTGHPRLADAASLQFHCTSAATTLNGLLQAGAPPEDHGRQRFEEMLSGMMECAVRWNVLDRVEE